ncbi:MAG: hypothetical protein HN919_20225 [Verrucomicrobia bacterium]|nr:hypothetical protein [Verrucomicrobiota bacterium]MBT7068634.1 hypothetical protein [Verrucomicrobiota bacterium]
MSLKDLEPACGLPVKFDSETCELLLGERLNHPSYCVRKLHDLGSVWANPVTDEDRVIYRYTSGLHLPGDQQIWRDANVIFGIVIFPPGTFNGEYVKSSGQFHPPAAPTNQATPEVYTVLSGTGHFMLQKASYDRGYEDTSDPVLVEVQAGESFVVPPDYGHLQINPSDEPLVFSYLVMDGMKGQYNPYKKMKGAAFYEMEDGFIRNPNYDPSLELRIIKAGDICQLPKLNENVTYQRVKEILPELKFITDPTAFSESMAL